MKMGIRRHRFLFNSIAFFYRWFFNRQVETYSSAIQGLSEVFAKGGGKSAGKTVLDLGCGTGAFTRALENAGFKVTGIDFAPKMVKAGRSRDIDCRLGDATAGLEYSAGSFDYVTAAFVIHGLSPEQRLQFYREATRLAKSKVIFYDYPQYRSFPETLVEFLEGEGYFSFVDSGLEEMRRFFPRVQVFPAAGKSVWYVCDVRIINT